MKYFHTTTRKKFLLQLSLMLMLFGVSFVSKAQFYNGSQLTFGKNRVQYNDFFWTFFRFNNFDVYYYLNGKELAWHTADYSRKYIPEIEKKLETALESKIQFIVYNTYADLKQSNLGLMNNMQYNTGGVTYIIGTKVFLYFDGDLNHFDRQIRAGITRILLENIIYGGTVLSQMKNSALINMPSWFSDGFVSYQSRNWDTELDNKMKDGILSGRYKKFNQLLEEDAVIAGHSLWRFVAEKYGSGNIANILYMTRVNRSVEEGFKYVLRVPFKTIMQEWYQWYRQIYEQESGGFMAYQPNAPVKIKREKVYDMPRISPNGEQLLYTTNEKGRYHVYNVNLASGKKECIFRKGFRSDEKIDYSYPLLAWHPSGQVIALITQHKGLLYLYFYDVASRKWSNQNIFGFQQISDFAYSPDGLWLVMSAVQHGQSDIYLYNVASGSTEAVTQDTYNDLNPRFLDRSSRIIFSSNRIDDTLRFEKNAPPLYNGQTNYDLFIYDHKPGNKTLQRVTRTTLANEIQPMSYKPGYFTFLSDANGIYNRYSGRYDSAVAYVDTSVHYRYFTRTTPLTNYQRSILRHDASYMGGKMADVVFENGKNAIHIGDSPQGVVDIANKPVSSSYMKGLEHKDLLEQAAKELKTNQPAEKPHRRKRFVNVFENDKIGRSDTLSPRSNEWISGDRRSSLLQNGGWDEVGDEGIIKLPQARNYNVEYTVNQLVGQIDFSYLNMSYQPYVGNGGPAYQNPPTNGMFNVGITDLLEDYRIIGGVKVNSGLINNEYLFGYADLKKRLDKELYFHRYGFDVTYSDAYVRHHVHELHYALRYPFTEVLALKGTLSLQHDQPVVMAVDYASATYHADANIWATAKAELVYDNTRQLGVNLMQGTRFKVFSEYYQLIKKNSVNMITAGFDFRNYIRIHRSLIWANRVAGATSFGKNRLLYYMGGVDNWLMPKFNNEYQSSQTLNYAFQSLATPLRGFKQNIRSGNTFALVNTELRLPLFRYLFNKPLKSDLLNNFQIVGFADAGSAWEGLNPFSEENTHYTKYISRPPLDITVKVQKDPLVAGYGVGLRSSFFGYFIRADWAWGIEDRTIQPRQFYISLSLDF